MPNIRIDLNHAPLDGETVSFKAPCNASEITGLIAYYLDGSGEEVSQEFTLNDANGNDIGMIDGIFAEGAIVKVILDTDLSNAFVQNPDTNAYLESRFTDLENKASPFTEDADHPGCYYRMVNGVKEWVNPPALVGEEFRTTERYNGKPVYVRLNSGIALPSNTYNSVALLWDYCRIIEIHGFDTATGAYFPTDNFNGDAGKKVDVCTYNGGYHIRIFTNFSASSSKTIYVFTKYYKTTD